MSIYKLYPECKDNVWGGTQLKEKYGKKTDKNPVAESWELSFHDDGPTRVESGEELRAVVSERDLGENCKGFPFFPMLVKFIDAKADLSVQVHPSDDYALKYENSFGKTEMWYIVDADEGAGIYLGFKKNVSAEEYRKAVQENTLLELLNFFKVKAGDCYFIPSGTIHAIGKGCLIAEIQQNSNLTYRVYDYGRVDKNGKTRELHIEKASKVSSLNAYLPTSFRAKTARGELLGASKYFSTTLLTVNGEACLKTDEKTFQCLSVVSGSGEIDGVKAKAGDSFFLTAENKERIVKGEMKVVVAEVRKYYVGIDLGGTFIKGGIVNDLGEIVLQDKVPTESEKGADAVAENIARLAKTLLEKTGLGVSDVEGLGMGVPGMINSKTGTVIYSNNLDWKDFKIGEKVAKLTGLTVKIANDANVAALGEVKFGAAKDCENAVLITLGTGVGGGIVANGELLEGNQSAGAEIGHSVIVANGEQCTCGRKGCFEAYSSATALIRDTKRAMQEHKNSKMWQTYTLETVNGKTAFDYQDTDPYAKAVVENYIELLAVGLTNIANIFRPNVILIGGGVCAQGDNLIKPLQKLLDRDLFAGEMGPQVPIRVAELGNSAGILGAAALLL